MRPVNAAGAVLARSANAAGGLDIHSVNAASAAHLSQIGNDAGASTASQSSNLQGLRYAQAECKEASSAAHSAVLKRLLSPLQEWNFTGKGRVTAFLKIPIYNATLICYDLACLGM